VAVSEHLIHRSANRLWGQVEALERAYPPGKTMENRNLAWLFFDHMAGEPDLHGL
jgi:hypothetical protein